MTNLPPAPEAVLQLVKCGCARERYVRPTDANVVKHISTALTSVTAAIVEIIVRADIVQMMILKKTRMLHMKVDWEKVCRILPTLQELRLGSVNVKNCSIAFIK